MESTPPARGFPEVHVGTSCHIQTAENRFGSQVLEDIKAFVYESPHSAFAMDINDEEEDEESDSEEISDEEALDLLEDLDWPNTESEDQSNTSPQADHLEGSQDFQNHHNQGFPRLQRVRCNLTALSQRYNLYFAAYADKIYVYRPKKAPEILPSPLLILTPRKTKMAKMIGGTIDRVFGHQINNILIGNLGSLEIVYFALDDGDVGAYYTHSIARCVRSNGGIPPRNMTPKEFFHDNVGLSAWGLAIHTRSRLLAVSSNRHEVTVFAFATTDNPYQGHPIQDDISPKLPSGTTALELEKHFQSRTRTWRIVFPTGSQGRNIPSIAFADDETGYAEKVLAIDVESNTWIFDIWTVGSVPIISPPATQRGGFPNHRSLGWGILVLPDSSFKPTRRLSEAFGLPENEIISPLNSWSPHLIQEPNVWLDITCSLFYVRDFAPDVEALLRQYHHGASYSYLNIHAESKQQSFLGPTASSQEDNLDDSWDMHQSENEAGGTWNYAQYGNLGQSAEKRWASLVKGPGAAESELDDLSETVQLSRTIVPSLGQTSLLSGNWAQLMSFTASSQDRNGATKPVKFENAVFSRYMTQNLTVLRTLCTDVELQPLAPRETGILCRGVLTHHDHHGRRNAPWDLNKGVSERISMLIHVPELNLVVAGALNGRVALLTLTKITTRVCGIPVRRGFRVDWVLPRRAEEEKRLRPWCALHGIAMSPVPDPKARGLDLHGHRGRLPHARFRLILHYVDHTILMYDIARSSESDDLMIF